MEDYRLEQSGQEVQDILNGAAMQSELTAETERATDAEQTLQGHIDDEELRAKGAESTLQDHIDDEAAARQGADSTLQDHIDAEETRAKAAEKQNADDIDLIEEKIPSAASSSNQLADKAFVNSSIATATATFRGTFNLVSDLHLTLDATEQQIATALAGAIATADNNDYAFVQIPTSDETPTQIAEICRYKYNGSAWAFEYALNNSGFTAAQWAAINSTVTSSDMTKLRALPTNAELTTLLNGLQGGIDDEETRAKAAELALQGAIDDEETRAKGVELSLQGAIGDEETARQGADSTLQDNIDAEETRAKAAEKQNADDIDLIEEKIPSSASSSNQLADKAFVNSSIATASATFRGTFNLVSDLHLTLEATEQQIATALLGAIAEADNNDYAFVQIPTSDEAPTEIAEIDRYKFNGSAWLFEYALNNSGFTSSQWAAINSGITANDVTKLSALPTNAQLTTLLSGKQDTLTFDSVPIEGSDNPVKSGGVHSAIDDEKGARINGDAALQQSIDGIDAKIPSSASSSNKLATASDVSDLSAAIEAILLLIPSAASSLNQLADKAFVNSSIATASATFRGTYNLVTDLGLTILATHAQIETALAGEISTADNNDYCFVQIPTSADTPTEIAKTERYKYNGSEWAYEYDLNNSGYTAAQWAAINSGITSALVTKLSALPTNADLTTALGALTDGIDTINEKIPSAASISNKLVDTSALESYVTQVINAIDATFNVTSTDGHVNVQITQVNGVITAVSVNTSDIASADALTVIGGRVSTNETDIAQLQAAYEALTESEPEIIQPTDTWPVANPSTDVIYRVVDRVNTPPEYYSDYMWNGTTMVLMATYDNAIDDEPTPGSNNLVKSGGVASNIVFDISRYNATGSTLATYADLAAALGTNGENVPADIRRGGMSIKFVHTADNKYVQARCIADEFTTDTTQWVIAEEGVYVDNPEFVYVKTDKDNKILWAIKTDGGIYYGAGVPQQVIDYINERIAELSLDEYEDIVAFLNGLEEGDKTLQTLLNEKVDKEEGKSLIDAEYANGVRYIENPEFAEVKVDAEDKVLEGIQQDGTKVIGGDLKVLGNMVLSGVSYKVIENPEYLAAWVDANDKVLFGFKTDGKTYVGDADFLNDIDDIKAFLQNITDKNIDWNALSSITTAENPEFIEAKTDSEGKLLAGRTPDGAAFENVGFSTPKVSIDGHTIENIEDPEERSEITTDNEGRIISYRDGNGTKHEEVGIETERVKTNHLVLTESGMNEFQQALINSGFSPKGISDWSAKTELHIGEPYCAIVNFSGINAMPTTKTDDAHAYLEFWDMNGNYFKKEVIANAQGRSTMSHPKKNIAIDICNNNGWDDDDTFKLQIGDWVPQDSFHLKAFYNDPFRCLSPVAYKLNDEILKTRGEHNDYVWKRGLFDLSDITATSTGCEDAEEATESWNNGARCFPMGFPCVVYLNGEFYGIYSWQLKKHRDNYMMSKKKTKHIHLDGIISTDRILNANGDPSKIWWTTDSPEGIEIRNPKPKKKKDGWDLVKLDGTKYDADANGGEIMSPTMIVEGEEVANPNWNPDDVSHIKSYEVKQYILNMSKIWPTIVAAWNTYTASSGTAEDKAAFKTVFETYLDVDNLIDYLILSDVLANYDGFSQNVQWITYDGVKWYLCAYDLDGVMGNYFQLTDHIVEPKNQHYDYCFFIYLPVFYGAEMTARYKELRDMGILTPEHICGLVTSWMDRLGNKETFDKEWAKWPGFIKNDNIHRLYKWLQTSILNMDSVYSYSQI